eukprot:gene3741-4315_t
MTLADSLLGNEITSSSIPLMFGNSDISEDMRYDLSGWKQVHGDVFRAPPHVKLFSSLFGVGFQMASLFVVALLMLLFGGPRSHVLSVVLGVFPVSSMIGGLMAGGFYHKHAPQSCHWARGCALYAALLPVSLMLVCLLLRLVTSDEQSLTTLSTHNLLRLVLIFSALSFPCNCMGFYGGYKWHPYRTRNGTPLVSY